MLLLNFMKLENVLVNAQMDFSYLKMNAYKLVMFKIAHNVQIPKYVQIANKSINIKC